MNSFIIALFLIAGTVDQNSAQGPVPPPAPPTPPPSPPTTDTPVNNAAPYPQNRVDRRFCPPEPRQALKAIVVISSGNATGKITFSQASPGAPVVVGGRLEKCLPEGNHGFHIHKLGDLSNGCLSAGAHFNPSNVSHAGPADTSRHVGDLGNVKADANGVVDISLQDDVISLEGPCSIIGRALVVHLKQDDLGKGGDAESVKTGNAGARIGCGVIGYA